MMDEMICPECGKENSANQTVCQFCQSRLAVSDQEIEVQHLPDWLEELRTDTATPPETRRKNESDISFLEAGPLDGLQGVLPVPVNRTIGRKPPVYTQEFQSSEKQQANALLFSQLIHSEGAADSQTSIPASKSQGILRLIITLALLSSIILALLSPSRNIVAPSMLNYPEALAAFQFIEKISPGQAVLFVVDFQPGAAGEMDAVAGAILQHLLVRNVRLVFVSTNTMGPMQAERLLQKANKAVGDRYKPLENYANLGFIPGGLAGILAFIQTPQRTLPVSSDGYSIWEQPSFHLIDEITDFSMVVVSTEQIDTARAWIEQLEPSLAEIPLLFAVSAQVEPVIMPYYAASPKQIQGLVSGWASAAAYASISYNPGSFNYAWAPFSYAGLTVLVLIILGGAINSLSRLKPGPQSHRHMKNEADQ